MIIPNVKIYPAKCRVIDNTLFIPVKGGVLIVYQDGTERYIANSWYDKEKLAELGVYPQTQQNEKSQSKQGVTKESPRSFHGVYIHSVNDTIGKLSQGRSNTKRERHR